VSTESAKPWWVSTGPPTSQSPKFEIPKVKNEKVETSEESKAETKTDSGFFGISTEAQSAAINSGLGLLSAFMDAVSKPLNGQEQTSTHDVETCGVCPLCVGVKALREHDENLADLVESAMKGVTSSAEKLKEILPSAMDAITESVVSAVIKSMMKR
jgi:hypothetical protein